MDRSVDMILAEWRACERDLAECDEAEREDLEARCAALQTEHRQAVALRENLAQGLRTPA